MEKLTISPMMLLACFTTVNVQQKPQIKPDKVTHGFGKFNESTPGQKYAFIFTNVGNASLIVNQAAASRGCTVPAYIKTPVQPGKKGEIKVTYNGKGRFPGYFKKIITVHTNGEPEITRPYIESVMEEVKK